MNIIIDNLKDMVPEILSLPRERFYDIWNELGIIKYCDMMKIKKEIPELLNHINSAISTIDFNQAYYLSKKITKDLIFNLRDTYPQLKYVDGLRMTIETKDLALIQEAGYFRDVAIKIKAETMEEVRLYHDLMINIIAKHSGKVNIAISVNYWWKSKSGRKVIENDYIVRYNHGKISLDSGYYLVDKIMEMKPEVLIINNELMNDVGSVAQIAAIPTIHTLSFELDPETEEPHFNLIRLLILLRYITYETSSDTINVFIDNFTTLNKEIINKDHIKRITFNYDGDICEKSLDYIDGIMNIMYININTEGIVFDKLEYISLPLKDDYFRSWCEMCPKVNSFISEFTFLTQVENQRIAKLEKIIDKSRKSICKYKKDFDSFQVHNDNRNKYQ